MCEDLRLYEVIKQITDLAAPILTIGSGMLGLFTETNKEVNLKQRGKTVVIRQLTPWAWVAMTGIILGGCLSIWAILNDAKIQEIKSCMETEQQSKYNAKVDSILKSSERTSQNLLASIRLTKGISDTTRESLSVLNNTYKGQLSILNQQNNLYIKNFELSNPFTPTRVTFIYELQLTDSNEIQKLHDYYYQLYNNDNKPYYLDISYGSYAVSDFAEYPDNKNYDSVYENYYKFLTTYIYPHFHISFYKDNVSRDEYIKRYGSLSMKASGNLELQLNTKYKTAEEINVKTYKLHYYYHWKEHKFDFWIIMDEPTNLTGTNSGINSLYEIKDGFLIIECLPTSRTKQIRLEVVTFSCGPNYNKSYRSRLSNRDRVNWGYHIPVKRLLANEVD